jgi:RHS repeat-associated protein
VTDALNREVIAFDYDVPGHRIHQASMEAGERWTLNDVTGSGIRGWDSRGHNFRNEYDPLRRPLNRYAVGTDAINSDTLTTAGEVLYEKIEYGEGQPKDQALNMRTRIFRQYDATGVVNHSVTDPVSGQTIAYDFKGNLLASSRQFIADHKTLPDWAKAPPTFLSDLFVAQAQYDALNRITAATTPDRSAVRPTYNEANLLETVSINLLGATAATTFVTKIDYDAKGQRILIDYGNDTSTTYAYDPLTFRLMNLVTSRPAFPANQETVQDLSYTYDPIGNVTHIQDDADIQNVVFFFNQRVDPSAAYTYDPIYRLIQASGRKQLGLSGGVPSPPWPSSYNDVLRIQLPSPSDGKAMGTYSEQFQYDNTGNMLSCVHHGSTPFNPGWTRTYTYSESSQLEPGKFSNRLTSTTVNGSVLWNENYTYDLHGSMTAMPQHKTMGWDFKEQLLISQRQAVNGSDSDGLLHQGERTYYVYNSTGERVRKTTESALGIKTKERFYLGPFEVYREYDGAGNVTLEQQTLNVMDDKRRIALVETVTVNPAVAPGTLPSFAIRFQFGNHLGSACLELDDAGAVITYEEYYPYGSTSYQAGRSVAETSLKRYRYTGKERDEETGLSYHGARYYATWLGRWTSCDPGPKSDTPFYRTRNDEGRAVRPGREAANDTGEPILPGQYVYCVDNPIIKIDLDGRQDRPPGLTPNDVERFNQMKVPILPFLFGPAHVGPYLRDQSADINFPLLRAQAQFQQQAIRAVTGLTRGLAGATIAFYGIGMTLALTATLAAPSVAAGGATLSEAYMNAGIWIAANYPRLTAVTTALAAAANGVSLPQEQAAGQQAMAAVRGVWDLGLAQRGLAIEESLGGNLPAGFPTIDRVTTNAAGAVEEVASIKSLDLAAKTYQASGRVLSTLTGYIERLYNFTTATRSGVTVTANASTTRVLEVAIPPGAANAQQLAEISQATTDAAAAGIVLKTRVVQ